jgi:hypothetical protein
MSRLTGRGNVPMTYGGEHGAHFGWWARLRFCYWLACGLWVEPRLRWLTRSLALY